MKHRPGQRDWCCFHQSLADGTENSASSLDLTNMPDTPRREPTSHKMYQILPPTEIKPFKMETKTFFDQHRDVFYSRLLLMQSLRSVGTATERQDTSVMTLCRNKNIVRCHCCHTKPSGFTFVGTASPSDGSSVFCGQICLPHSFDVDLYLGCFILTTNTSGWTREGCECNQHCGVEIPVTAGFAVCVNSSDLRFN